MLIATCSSDLIVTHRGGPYNVVTQLRDNPSCKSPLLGVHLRKGVIFWVSTHAPQPLISCPGSVSTFLSYHARGSPLGVALSWVVSAPGSPSGGMGTSQVRLLPTGTKTMALRPPFSSLHYCPEVLRFLMVSPPPRSFLPMGIGGWYRRCLNLATPPLGDAYIWRRLHLGDAYTLATPPLGDAYTLATPQVVNSLTFFLGSLEGAHHMLTFDFDFDFGQRPGTGRYTNLKLELTYLTFMGRKMLKST